MTNVLLPGPFHRDRRGDVNALGGSPDRTIDQAIRGLEAHLFGAGGRDESLKLGDRVWRETSEPHLGDLNHFFRLGLRLGRRAAVRPTDGLTPSSIDSRPDTSAEVYSLEIRRFKFQCCPQYPPASTR